MDFNDDGSASEQDIQEFMDMTDRMAISEQLRLFCEAVEEVGCSIGIISTLGYRLQSAVQVGVLNEDEFAEWEAARLSYFRLVLEEALAIQGKK